MVAAAREGAPDVDHLETRALEQRALVRGFVRFAEVSATSPTALVLRTVGGWSTTFTDWGEREPDQPDNTHGALRIDIVSDGVVRIRYRPDAADVDEAGRDLGMVVATLPPPSTVDFDGTTLRTPSMIVAVEPRPFTVTISDPDGNERGRIGGRGKNQWGLWDTHGYGVFWNTTARMTAWVGTRNAADIQIAAEDDQLDTYVFIGDPKAILDRYTTLTGKAHVPPDWSFGWRQSKISDKAVDDVLRVVGAHRGAGVPIDVVHLDTFWFRADWRNDLTFSPERFPDPAGFLRELRDLGVHNCLWQLPYVPEGSPLFDELAAADAFVHAADGGMYDVRVCYTPGFDGRAGIVDFTTRPPASGSPGPAPRGPAASAALGWGYQPQPGQPRPPVRRRVLPRALGVHVLEPGHRRVRPPHRRRAPRALAPSRAVPLPRPDPRRG